MSTTNRPLRSAQWFGAEGRNGFIHRSWMRNQGFADDVFDGRPVIGIANTWSELTPCNAHLRDARRGGEARRVAGGRPAAGVPGDEPGRAADAARPTMLFRNLMAMEVEESIRANPLDGVVLLSGCDKTTPGLLMGAASVDLPAIMVTGGPMLSGSSAARTSARAPTSGVHRGAAGRADDRGGLLRGRGVHVAQPGHCMTMGTASTMACVAEALACSCRRRRDPGGRRARYALAAGGRPADRGLVARGPAALRSAHPRRRSRTPSGSTPRSAAPPTRSSTCSRIAGRVGVAAGAGRLRRALAATCPCSSTCMPSGRT